MNLQPSPITGSQWRKVVKSLYYSFTAGFVGGFVLALTGALSALLQHSGNAAIGASLVIALVTGGVIGGLNALAVTVKQLFTTPPAPSGA